MKILPVLLLFFISCSRTGNSVRPQRKNIVEAVYASGKIIAENEYSLFALGSGRVKERKVKEGDVVVKDQVLYVISSEAPAARLEAARGNFENARSNASGHSSVLNELKLAMQSAAVKFSNDSLNYFRLKNLLQQSAASQASVDNAYTAYTLSLNQKKTAEDKYHAAGDELNVALGNAKSQLAAAQADIGNYIVKAEARGTVYQLNKQTGETVRAGEPIALLGETDARIIRLAVDQQDIIKIKTGQEVLLKTDVSGNRIFKARVTRIYPVMNEIDQTFRVDAVFSGPGSQSDSTIQPYIHSSLEANIVIQQKQNAMVVPRNAFVADDSIQVKQDGKIKTVAVQAGIRTLDEIEILSGIDESAEVMIPAKR